MHRSIVRQRWIFSAFAVLAVSLAIVGLLGLASSAAEERRLEIGIRKAFGAGSSAIAGLILWRFAKIAAAAGAIGCVMALPLMGRWLETFEDRIDLQPWMFAERVRADRGSGAADRPWSLDAHGASTTDCSVAKRMTAIRERPSKPLRP